ncbi:MAG: AEC family transporter [Desulfotignum sp.]|nr:AEC family transporter [Desulfotignum sp.]MCF8114184.1 AEC family transporter [Desulfotignum sp.]MCF8126786.1 AEC family transporter [Desulfotignum sp.]
MQIFNTIIPIFSVIFLGWLARQKGFIPASFTGPANRLVFYFAIPAMVFAAIAKGSLTSDFNPVVLGCTLAAVGISFGLTWIMGRLCHVPQRRFGTFVQSAVHGNLGYIGLAVAYYYLGQEGFVSASLLIGFIMILQNLLSVSILQFYNDTDTNRHNTGRILLKIMGNPVIISAVAGISFSLTGAGLPMVLSRTLDIISGMALPLALLLIGAALNFDLMKSQLARVLPVTIIKLVLVPAAGLVFYTLWNLPPNLYLPGLILLASPSATISYVMAMEMNGDVEFAVTAISVSTLMSAISFAVWLHII